ncbi:MAG: sigma 54-interacting transcriptional regulator [Deltaproteobacteria bacterium]|nr:sigma 54-interacting transcriptional regulator [Deltaproteobacteria bacterium]
MGRLDITVGLRNRVNVRGGRIRIGGDDSWVDVGQDPVIVGRNPACQVVVEDGKVSAVHVEFVATEQGVKVRDLGSRNGTFVADVRVGEVCICSKCTLRVGATEVDFEPVRPEKVTVPPIPAFGPLVGHSEAMRKIFDRLSKVAPTDLTLLIGGDTGTGKELCAKAVHLASKREKKPFIVVDCGSIPPSLAEATLFGHERGAFTGAVDKHTSPFHDADGGSIFLDELGELPLEVQPKLLRALSERRVKSVGGSAYKPFDVRVIAATRRDLVRAVNQGGFRSDLYFRVAQVRVELPPLDHRVEDIPILVRAMLKDLGDEGAYERVTNQQLERLMRYDWPGNVRELRNAVAVAYALSDSDQEIDVASHLGALVESGAPNSGGPSSMGGGGLERRPFQEAKREVLARFAKDYFSRLAEEAKGNVSEMARRAGMERAHVRTYLKRHNIDVKQYR